VILPVILIDPWIFKDPDNSVEPDKVGEYIVMLKSYINSLFIL